MSNILLNRTGALGDVFEVTSIAHRLKAEGSEVAVRTNYPQVFEGNADLSTLTSIDQTFDLNMAFERDLRQLHPIDSFSKVVFGDTNTEHKIYFNFTPVTTFVLNSQIVPQPIAVLHAARSWPIRTLPRPFWQNLIDKLVFLKFQVVLTGTHQDWDGLSNCLDLRSHLNLMGQAALIDHAKVFICSESGPMIFAQATSAHIIALTTMVPPAHIIHRRGAGAKTVVIQSNVPCVGCAARWPTPVAYLDCEHGPHRKAFRSCLNGFNPTAIAATAFELSAGTYQGDFYP
jgi:Glycosyltransferase family 9 (heptosyltransferase)